jgi:hypothetical protein
VSPMIELSIPTFTRLQSHAVPLVDTIESVINRLLDAADAKANWPGDGQSVRTFNPDAPPDLTHAKILGVSFNGAKLGRGEDNWNGLLHAAVRVAVERAKTKDHLKALMVVNYVEGPKQDEGYRPLLGGQISVQGQDANGAWRAAKHIAQQLGIALSVKFAWREKEGAAFPGLTGQMLIEGK